MKADVGFQSVLLQKLELPWKFLVFPVRSSVYNRYEISLLRMSMPLPHKVQICTTTHCFQLNRKILVGRVYLG